MKTFTNEIEILCNPDAIDEKYDIYQLKSSEKYIQRGSKILDLGLDGIKSIAFDDGASLFILLEKNSCKTYELNELVDETISVKKISPETIKPYILARLFLFSLANSEYEEYSFSNLSGKLYLFKPEWIGCNRKHFKALNIDIKSFNDSSKITCNACSFSSIKMFKSPKVLETFPRYVFSIKGTLKRTFDKNENAYIRRSFNGKKADVPFLSFSEKEKRLCRTYILLNTIETFNKQFNGLVSLKQKTKEIVKKIDTKRDEFFFEKIVILLSGKDIYLSNYDKNPEGVDGFNQLVRKIEELIPFSNVIVTSEIQKKELNIVLIHNQDYYLDNNLSDPYKTFDRSTPIQCVTVEDACSESGDAVFKTIIKELQIKNEIINEHKLFIDDWKTFNYLSSWVFGIQIDNVSYFMNISPDGAFKMIKKQSQFVEFKEEIYNKLERLMLSYKGDDKRIVADDKGNINLIVDSSIIPLPDIELFNSESPRGKESKNSFLSGVLDINVYNDTDLLRYSVGPVGKTLNKTIPSAPHIYETRVLEGQQKILDIIETLGVQFVRYNSYTVVPYPFKYLNEFAQMCKLK